MNTIVQHKTFVQHKTLVQYKTLAQFKIIAAFVSLCVLIGLPACSATLSAPTVTVPVTPPTPRATRSPELVSLPRFERASCPFVLPDDVVQGENVTCGYLVVPENRDQLPSRAIRLAVGIFYADGGADQADPIVYLSGGPGGSALEMIRYQFDAVFAPVMEAAQRDLIVFDQRGVGRSRPALDCPDFVDLSVDLLDGDVDGQVVGNQQAAALIMETLRDCASDLSQVADLSAYNSASSAADVRDLSLALGYEQVNLWGGSYGTRLALTVIRDHPDGVRSVVLDAVYPPDADLYLEAPANLDRALNLLLDSCADNPVCNGNYPDLRGTFFDTVERLNAQPVSSTITNTLTGEAYPTVVNGNTLIGFVFQVLYETEFKYLLPQIIHDASQDDFAAMNRVRGALLTQMSVSSHGMTLAVQCNEEVSFSSATEYDRMLAGYPKLAGFYERSILGRPIYAICEAWHTGSRAEIENQPVASDIPTLLIVGEFDPITPPAWAQHAAATLSNSFSFVYPGVGHGASASACGCDMMLAFLNNPTVAPADDCINMPQAHAERNTP